MPASRADCEEVFVRVVQSWIDDPETDVVAFERVDDRWAVRLRQATRDFTTLWFDLGDRSVRVEAYVLPDPPHGHREVYRQCLARNADTWRVRFAVDGEGSLVLRGRVPLECFSEEELSLLVAEIYQEIERVFRPLIRAGWKREK